MACGFKDEVKAVIIVEWILFAVAAAFSGFAISNRVYGVVDFPTLKIVLGVILVLMCAMNLLLLQAVFTKSVFFCKTWSILSIILIGLSVVEVGYLMCTLKLAPWLPRIALLGYKAYAIQTILKFASFLNKDNISERAA